MSAMDTPKGLFAKVLADRFKSAAQVEDLLERAGVPVERLPAYGTSLSSYDFWLIVLSEVGKGLVDKGSSGLLVVHACNSYPGSARLREAGNRWLESLGIECEPGEDGFGEDRSEISGAMRSPVKRSEKPSTEIDILNYFSNLRAELGDGTAARVPLNPAVEDWLPPTEAISGGFGWIDTAKEGRKALWRKVPVGSFIMGGRGGSCYENEMPCHEVVIKAPFLMSIVPVTNSLYESLGLQSRKERSFGLNDAMLDACPVVNVSWDDAIAFCLELSRLFPWAEGARLPTEEEWEYVCRAGTVSSYWFGEKTNLQSLSSKCWYEENSGQRIHRVAQKEANPFGFYDMHGNVCELMQNLWVGDYSARVGAGFELDPREVDRRIPFSGVSHGGVVGGRIALRGGSYWDSLDGVRASFRTWDYVDGRDLNVGFRVVVPWWGAC